ncbi:DsbA family protein [Pleomorphomonas sp. PLEO]|uniref:DsbA family protein n=1 Tax=Pleomorphomonas sp. PLEO TaxID=3239306 RepID=UPI00351DD738
MRITYLFDPLCGWCYGAGPALERLAGLDGVTLSLAPTGLFAGAGARPMEASFAAYAWQNDQRIARLTGQPFSQSYRRQVLGASGGLFDSAPATLGIIAAGLDDAGHELTVLKRLQAGRYQEGRDIADRAVVADILDEAGFTAAAGRVRTLDAGLIAAYDRRTAAARADMQRFGFEGVPSLVIDDGAGRRPLRGSALFGGFDQLTAQLRAA